MISPIIPLINGVVLGLIYMLIALGFSLIFGVMKLANVAHGHIAVIGSYLLYFFYVELGINLIISAVLVLPILFLIGVGVEEYVVRPLRHTALVLMMILIAVAILLDNLPLVIWGPTFLHVPSFVYFTIDIGGYTLHGQQLISIFTAIPILVMLYTFLLKTRLGKAVRMVAEEPELATLSGVNCETVYRVTYGTGYLLAGCGGILLAPLFGIFAPVLGWTYFIKAISITVLGGLGSISGTAIAAVTLGLAESLFGIYVSSAYRDVIYLIAIVFVLSFRPTGILGRAMKHV